MSSNLYDLLCVAKDASQAELKKAYYKLALQLHPDKNPNDEVEKIGRAYAVLMERPSSMPMPSSGSCHVTQPC